MGTDTMALLVNLRDSDDDVRRDAAEGLQHSPTPEVINALVETLSDPNRGVAEAAENSLLNIRGSLVIQKVIPLLSSEEPKLRNFSFEMLSEIGNDSINDIIALLKDDDKDLRKFAVDILGELNEPACVNALIVALDDSDINVAAAAAESLGKINAQGAIPELVRKIDSDVWMQCSVIKSLSMFNDEKANKELYRILPTLSGMSLYSAISALSEMGDASAIPLLIDLLAKQTRAFKGSIVNALERIIRRGGDEQALNIDKKEIDKDELLELMYDDDIQTRLSAIDILGWLKNEAVVEALVKEFIDVETKLDSSDYKTDIKDHIFDAIIKIGPNDISYLILTMEALKTPFEIKAELIDIMGKLKNHAALDSLVRLKDSDSVIIRRVVARTLGEFDSFESVQTLKSLLRDSDGHTRANSANSLGKLRVESAADDLIALLDDEYPNIRESAAVAIADIGTSSIIDKLRTLLTAATDNEKKRLGLLALGRIDNPVSVGILVDHFDDKDPQIRKITIESISKRYASQYCDKISELIDDEDNDVKIAAIKGLSGITPFKAALPLLSALKKSSNLKIRYHIIEALGNIKATSAVSDLIALLDDKSSITVLSAIEALGEIGDKRAVKPLQKLCGSDDRDIAVAAQEALDDIDKGF